MKLKDTDECTFCQKAPETIAHIFFDCTFVKNIWDELKTWIEEKTDSKLNFSKRNICLGYPQKRNMILNLLITVVKYKIYTSKCKGFPPKINCIKEELRQIYEIDKSICYSNCQFAKFIKFWSVCHNLFIE